MSNAKRKIARNQKKRVKKEMKKKLSMITDMPEACLACEKAFDKTSEEQVKSWFVVVRKESDQPNLYCPECWAMANKIIEEFREKKQRELTDQMLDEAHNDN
tara:strand:+ start:673 stop:978 length:306 start_codon:yes stop_codon:yes gene_type:complete